MSEETWSPELRRAWVVAAYARRFRLLATNFGYGDDDREDRIRYALGAGPYANEPPPHLFDLAGIAGASELDRFCGQVVAFLAEHWDRLNPQVVDLLGNLEPDRVAAIYFALPPNRRGFLRRDFYWETFVGEVERELPEAERRLRELIEATPASDIGYVLAAADL